MSWIETVEYEDSDGHLRKIYDRVRSPEGQVDAILRLHSLRPHTLEGHLALYKSVLHHTGNRLPAWFLEAVGTYVSRLNGCEYCLDHHFEGLRRLLADDDRAARMRRAIESGRLEQAFDARGVAALEYAELLTRTPDKVDETALGRLREAGFHDGEILEINQVIAYFAYANRTVQGLGGRSDAETLGLSPGTSADADDWRHR